MRKRFVIGNWKMNQNLDSINNFFSRETNIKIVKALIDKLNIKNYIIKNLDGKFSNKTLTL